jgi:hypothetical protein
MSEEVVKKPTAVITLTRLTSQEESVQVSLTIGDLTEEAIFNAVTIAGEALCRRVAANNAKLMNVKSPVPAMADAYVSGKGGSA